MEHIIEGILEGYLWKSDLQEPEIYTKEKPLSKLILNDEENPFVIEGQLCDGEFSYSIKYVDGEHKVSKYNIEEAKENGITRVHHFKGNNKLKGHNLLFFEVWEAKPDSNCCNMEVFEAKKVIFGGFE